MSPPAQQRAELTLSYVQLSQFVAPLLLRDAWTAQARRSYHSWQTVPPPKIAAVTGTPPGVESLITGPLQIR